jgi:hypothetical protein
MHHSLEKKYHIVGDHSVCGVRLFQGSSLLQHCPGKGDEYHTATAFYLTTLFKTRMGLTQAAIHHGENDQSRKTVDASEQISDRYYQSVDSQESDHLNQVNENIVEKACDTVGDYEDSQFPEGRQTALKLPLALANTTKSSTRVNLLS